MVREIHIVNSRYSNFQLFYNGHKDEKHREEYDSIDLLLKSTPQKLKDFNPKKPIRVYLEGYTDSQNISLSAFLKRIYPKAEFEVVEGIKELHFVHMPNSDSDNAKYFVYEGSVDPGNEQEYKTLDDLFNNLPQNLKDTSVNDRVCASTHDFSRQDESKLKSKLNSLFEKVYYNCWKDIDDLKEAESPQTKVLSS